MRNLYTHSFRTSFGTIRTAATANALAVVALPNMTQAEFQQFLQRFFPNTQIDPGGEINLAAEEQIQAFLAGKLKKFSLKLEVVGTPFQKEILGFVAAIPYGTVRTYGEIAALAGHPKAFRAVGTANARNPLPLVIPCHRVVAVNGLGGYGGGLDMKTKLLKM